MKKNKILIITLILGILFLTSYLYNSYATSTGLSLGNNENTYDILLNDSTDTVTVPAKSSKTIYYQFSNTNKGTVKYHIGYTSNNVTAKVWWDTEDPISGTIEQGEYKFIKLKLINDTTSDDTITIKPVLGYVNGGDVIPDSNTILVTGTINETNYMNVYLNSGYQPLGLSASQINEIVFVDDNIVPINALGSRSVSLDGSVILWYVSSETEGLYKLYIGSDNGITTFSNNLDEKGRIFANYSNLTYIDLNLVDTSMLESMQEMFANDSKLSSIILDNMDVSNVKNMYKMFSGCSSLTELNLDNFETTSVKNMSYMFDSCSSLTSLDLGNFDTANVTNMSYMFNGCNNIEYINFDNFNTKKVDDMNNMFTRCYKLRQINLNNFDTSMVKNMRAMFFECKSLTLLDLSSFDIDCVNNIINLFNGCEKLQSIYLNNADLSGITSNYNNMLNKVPTTVNIYLKDTQGNRDFMSSKFSTYTNVQYIPSS